MDKTYAEACGAKPFDWNQFLDNPPAPHSSKHKAAIALARQWPTCACGNQCAIIPRKPDGRPLDGKLEYLGAEFVGLVAAWMWDEAKQVLAAIEARAAVVVAETLAKLTAAATPARTGPDGKGEGL